MNYQNIWILAEQTNGMIDPVSFELITRGLDLKAKRNCQLCAMVFGHQLTDSTLEQLTSRGVDEVVAIEAPELAHFLVEPYAEAMTAMIDDYKPEVIIAAATTTGRTLMPYVAIKSYAGLTADCTVLDIEADTNNLLQTRPAIGGNIMATIKCPDCRPQMATVRPHSTRQAPIINSSGRITRKTAAITEPGGIRRLQLLPNDEELALQDAEIVVAVGRGIKKAENLPIIREFANLLGAALGASRDVVDRGWLSYPHQIGLSGKTISPKLYIGIGLSGAIQHLAGMQTSEHVVAINKDPDAQLFKVADIGIVGDLFDVIPAITQSLKQGNKEPFNVN